MKRRNFDLPHFHRLLEYLCWSIILCTCYHHAKYIITSDWAMFFFSSHKKSISMPNSIVYWIGINVELCDQNKRFKFIVQNVLYSCLRATVFSSSIQNGFSENCTQVLRSPWKWMWNWTYRLQTNYSFKTKCIANACNCIFERNYWRVKLIWFSTVLSMNASN